MSGIEHKLSMIEFIEALTPCDYPSDYDVEDGVYQHTCVTCKSKFYGHMHRSECSLCANQLGERLRYEQKKRLEEEEKRRVENDKG